MGWCHEFGSEIRHGCDHPMVAGGVSCSCAGCGVVCTGRFGGCAEVWARGPRTVVFVRPVHAEAPAPPDGNGHGHGAVAPAAEAAVGGERDVLDWLVLSLEGVRGELRTVADRLARVDGDEAAATQAAVSAHLVELVEALPDRIGTAVGLALQAHAADLAVSPPAALPGTAWVPPAPPGAGDGEAGDTGGGGAWASGEAWKALRARLAPRGDQAPDRG